MTGASQNEESDNMTHKNDSAVDGKTSAITPEASVSTAGSVPQPTAGTSSAANAAAQAVIKPVRPPKQTDRDLRVEFTERELLEIGKRLAEANRELVAADDNRKAMASQLKARCDGIQARVDELSNQLTAGYTFRRVPCEVRFDAPSRGLKSVYRLDTGALLETESMTHDERQAELPGIAVDQASHWEKRPPAEVLTTESWDGLDLDPMLIPDRVGDETAEKYITDLRSLFVDNDEELLVYPEGVYVAWCHFKGTHLVDYIQCFLAWLETKGDYIPGAAQLFDAIREMEDREKAKSEEYTAGIRKRICDLFLEGRTQPEISKELSLSVPEVTAHLKALGLVKGPGRKRATAHGTVSVPSDEGSRDDVGEDSKNKL